MTKRELTLVAATVLLMCIPLGMVAHKNYQLTSLPSTAYDWSTIKANPTKTGERRNFFDSQTETLDNLECHVTTLNAGELSHKPHQHPEEELIVVKEGTIEVLVNGELKQVGPGSVIFQAPNTLHSTKNVGTGPAVYHAIKWRSVKTAKQIK